MYVTSTRQPAPVFSSGFTTLTSSRSIAAPLSPTLSTSYVGSMPYTITSSRGLSSSTIIPTASVQAPVVKTIVQPSAAQDIISASFQTVQTTTYAQPLVIPDETMGQPPEELAAGLPVEEVAAGVEALPPQEPDAPAPKDEFGGRLPDKATPATSFTTMCLYAGQEPDPTTGTRVTPIHQNTGFVFKNTDDAAAKFALQEFGPIYTRIGNPTCDALEKKIAMLEGGMAALSVSSGHAAQMTCFTNLLNAGDNFIATKQLYGGSVTQFQRQFKQFGWEARFFDCDDYEGMRQAIDENTKAIYCESICNPGGVITDLCVLAQLAHSAGLPLIVDNTTATPYLCRPFEYGADIVLHSATKYLSGHGNALCGFIVEKGDFDWSQGGKFPTLSTPCDSYHGLNFYEVFGKDGPVAGMFGTKGKTGMAFTVGARALGLRDVGACVSPFNAFLVSMGMETLALRMDRHCSNALQVAQFLQRHPEVAYVTYAGLPNSKYSTLARKYCPKGASGLFTFSCTGGYEKAKNVVNSVKMISLVANLGDTRTLIAHPASMMHSQLSDEQKAAAGADPSILRLSIGIEDVDDIINDLNQALSA